jgi:hypothetical protein
MLLKYKTIDKKEIKVKLDVFKQNPKQWGKPTMENLFTNDKIEDVKQRRRFHSRLHPKIKKLCVMHDYVNNMDVIFL